MGVRGLTTFISKNDTRYFEEYKLHNTFVIIDGNSLACQLFCLHGTSVQFIFGGDYDKYAQYFREFLQMLSQCNVKPVVVFDGGNEKKKLKTVINRLREKTALLEYIAPDSDSAEIVFPLLVTQVFRQVLLEVGVPMVQTDFEADQEIAAMGHKYNCPILSYDSDFFIYDVQYIPIPSIEHEARPLNFSLNNASNQYCIHCKIFRVQNLLCSYSGLNRSMLPLLSALSGNDYVEFNVFKNFHSQLTTEEYCPADVRVSRVIEWLNRVGGFDAALQGILSTIERSSHHYVLGKIIETIESYTCNRPTLESYLPSELTSRSTRPSSNPEPLKVNQNSALEKSNLKIPDWLLNNSRKGLVSSIVIDILTLKTCISRPQVEDKFLNPCHEASIPLLRALIKILHGGNKISVSYWARHKHCSIQEYHLTPLKSNLPNLENVLKQSPESARNILLGLLSVPVDFCMDTFPDEWKLYLCTIFYWIKNTTRPLITEVHVKSLVLSLIALNIIDIKLGFIREILQFLSKYGTKLSRHTISPKKSYHHFGDLLLDIDEHDCIVCFDSLFKFHRLNEDLISDSSVFSFRDIHAFAQFQCCLRYAMILNSLLLFPLKPCMVHRLFSGTFVYNVCSTLNNHKNVEEVIQKLLCKSPKLFEVYRTLVSVILTPTPSTAAPSQKSRRRRRKP